MSKAHFHDENPDQALEDLGPCGCWSPYVDGMRRRPMLAEGPEALRVTTEAEGLSVPEVVEGAGYRRSRLPD